MKKRGTTILTFVLMLMMVSCNTGPSMTDMEEWDLVWISDSSGWGVAEVYAAMVEEDTGVKVNLNDYWMSTLSAGEVYNALKGEPTPRFKLTQLADLVKEAEIIIFYANPMNSIASDDPADWVCIGFDSYYVKKCQDFETYIQHLEGVYQFFFDLRNGQPTIIRAYDAYNPRIAEFDKQGAYEECKDCWADYNAAIHQAADKYHVPVAKVAEAWNGPNWDKDPIAMGYTKDGEHPSELGAEVIAQALRELGYKPVTP